MKPPLISIVKAETVFKAFAFRIQILEFLDVSNLKIGTRKYYSSCGYGYPRIAPLYYESLIRPQLITGHNGIPQLKSPAGVAHPYRLWVSTTLRKLSAASCLLKGTSPKIL